MSALLPLATREAGSASSFQGETIEVVRAVRDAFARMIEHRCPGSKVVSNLCEGFRIHRKLAWRVSKVAYSEDPFVAALHIPSGRGLTVWFEAAEAAGVPQGMVGAARRAALRFEELAAAHAGSRAELEMLLESCTAAGDVETHAKWREQSFVGNSFVWGAHCKVLLALMVLVPSDDRPGHFHAVQVRGLMGYRQTRPGVRWVVNQAVVAHDPARAEVGIRRVALDEAAARLHGGVPVLPRFCSEPVPRLVRRNGTDGIVADEFVSAAIGLGGARTLVTGEVARNIGPAHATERDKVAHFGTAVRIPAELLHFDLFVHHGLFGDVERELRVFSDLASPIAFDEADALAAPERFGALGRGVSLAQTPDLPGYTDLASWVFDALREEAGEYELYRARLAFPPMPTTVMMRHALREKGGGAK